MEQANVFGMHVEVSESDRKHDHLPKARKVFIRAMQLQNFGDPQERNSPTELLIFLTAPCTERLTEVLLMESVNTDTVVSLDDKCCQSIEDCDVRGKVGKSDGTGDAGTVLLVEYDGSFLILQLRLQNVSAWIAT